MLSKQIKALIAIQRGLAAAATLLGFGTEVLLPHVRRILTFATMPRNALAHATNNRRIDCCPRDNYLTLGERRQVIQQIAANTLDGRRDALLINLVYNAHDALCLALAEYIGIEFAGALTD
jgi:hypothetical protein